MKKYGQITIVLGMFFVLVYFRHLTGNDKATPVISRTTTSQNPTKTNTGTYKDGTYIGDTKDAFYGNIQVQVVISGGKISDVQFLQYPNDNPTSTSINEQAIPLLKQEAIQAQSAHVDIVSGASDSSVAFKDSLSSALQRAV